MLARVVLFLFFMLPLSGCTQSTGVPEDPEWLLEMIATMQSEPVGNPPQAVWRYYFEEQFVYYIPGQCCDQYGTIYNYAGDIICHPDGGFSGNGDGRCPDFAERSRGETLIWQDSRVP